MIELAPILPQHKEQLFDWRNDIKIYKWCRQHDLLDWNSHCAWFDKLGFDKTIKMYIIKKHNEMIGVCGLTDIDLINQRAEFSLYIASSYQKKGYGKIALIELLFHAFLNYPFYQIWGESFSGNKAIKIFESIGFILDGTRKKFYFKDGQLLDANLFSITRKQFYAFYNNSFFNNTNSRISSFDFFKIETK